MSQINRFNTFGNDHVDPETSNINKFKNFLKEFYVGNYDYKYRNQLKEHYNLGEYWISISLEDLDSYDEVLSDRLKNQPTLYMEYFEQAATDVCDDITQPRPEGNEIVPHIQVMVTSICTPTPLRYLNSDLVSKLVTISGIIVTASQVRSKATSVTIQCIGCRDSVANIPVKRGLDGYSYPRKCPNSSEATGTKTNRCPLDPYRMLPEKCKCIDFQTLKLQELPEDTPQGGMPKHMKIYCDRQLCDKFVPGNRVTLFGIFSIIKIGRSTTSSAKGVEVDHKIGLRASYINVVGFRIETAGPGHTLSIPYTADEEEEFRMLASSKDCYEKIYSSIAPSIFGFEDVKRAIATLLFSGSVKCLPDGTKRRGDINILLLGDPGTAKSQVLKFAERVAPIGVYTSGKGSSAAGLTASVIRDNSSRSFSIEGGAMVLADGGIVCIDEFDKMREDDRVAIHEAMEQQTISIAKAGITVTLNSRCSVLAAANSVHGRWDDYRSDEDNIDFMPTILSRFDMIFVIKDKYDYESDLQKARHVVNIHLEAESMNAQEESSELSLEFLKKYISYCRTRVGPRVSESAAKTLVQMYADMRNGPAETVQATRSKNSSQNGSTPATNGHGKKSTEDNAAAAKFEKKSTIPITVRQFEATIRISEALAKMEMKPFANEQHVKESLRLFKESTLKSSQMGHLIGADEFITDQDRASMATIEKTIKRRLSYGLLIDEESLIREFVNRQFNIHLVKLVIMHLVKASVLSRKNVPRGKLVCTLKSV